MGCLKSISKGRHRMHEVIKRLLEGDVPNNVVEIGTAIDEYHFRTYAHVALHGNHIQVYRYDPCKGEARDYQIYDINKMTMNHITVSIMRYLRREVQRRRHCRGIKR